jgi:Tfp pilus assembly protein PilN
MQSIGLVFKKEEMTMVSLSQPVSDIYLEGYRILPFLDFKEEEKEEAILHNLERFLKTYKEGKYNIFIALPRDIAFLQFLNLPMAAEENLRATLGYEMDRHTPFSFDNIYFDYHIIKRRPESNLLYVMLITIKKDLIDYYLNLLNKINVRPRGIEITTTALFNTFQKGNTPSENLLDTDWLKKNPYFRKYVLKYLIKLSPKLAEFFKEPEAAAESPPSINILVEYLQDDNYELNVTNACSLYYSRVFRSEDIEPDSHYQQIYNNAMKAVINLPDEKETGVRFLLSGKEMERDCLEHIPEKISSHFSVMRDMPVRLDKHKEAALPTVLPLLSVPIGLALKGLKSVAIDINLVPPQLRQKKKRSKKKILAAAAAVLLVFSGAAWFVNDIIKMNVHHMMLSEQLLEIKKQVKEIEDLQAEAEKIEQFSKHINKIRDRDISKLKILEELTSVIPEDSYLHEFIYKGGKTVKLSGYAVSASKLIPSLEESELFENVKFVSPITTDKRANKERFRIEMTISPEKSKA